MPFLLDYSHEALRHLRGFSVTEQRRIASAVDEQLKHLPDVATSNRKPLRNDIENRWELRIGDFRVFYRVLLNQQTVVVTAVGQKTHNRLLIDGEEVEL